MIHYTKNEPHQKPAYYACYADGYRYLGSLEEIKGLYVFLPSGDDLKLCCAQLRDIFEKLNSINTKEPRGTVDEIEACTEFTTDHPPK